MSEALVLIVDDNELGRKLLRDVLQIGGYRTAEAGSGEEALRILAQQRPALVILDIRLPCMNGFAVVKHMREDPATSSIPAIAVTASAFPIDKKRILDAGFDACHAKPINVQAFVNEVHRLVAAAATRAT